MGLLFFSATSTRSTAFNVSLQAGASLEKEKLCLQIEEAKEVAAAKAHLTFKSTYGRRVGRKIAEKKAFFFSSSLQILSKEVGDQSRS